MTVNIATQDGPRDSTPVWKLGLEVDVVDFLSGYRVPGMLEGITLGEVIVSLGEPLSEQREATVHLNSFAFQGEILYFQSRESRYEAHITIDDADETSRRRTPRFPVKLPAQLFPAHAGPVDITVLDVSSEGLGIESPVPLEIGDAIALATESVFVFAVVRYCRQLSGGPFRAGVEMLHLSANRIGVPAKVVSSRFLGAPWRKRHLKKGP
ncbi:MAG TPA: PilZ domain-containing protein [Bryobacteraceae bacterium]|nr:PilZ domain-containing protein [Bryobacteraceae bacterium]